MLHSFWMTLLSSKKLHEVKLSPLCAGDPFAAFRPLQNVIRFASKSMLQSWVIQSDIGKLYLLILLDIYTFGLIMNNLQLTIGN